MEVISTRSPGSEIEDYKAPNLKDFTPNELSIHKAKFGTPVKDLPPSRLWNDATAIWVFIKTKWGLRDTNAAEENASIENIKDDLLSKPNMTINEAIKCLNMAMDGEYGESSFFSSARFRGWLKKYYEDSRIIAGRVQLAIDAQNEAPKPPPSEEESKRISIELANKHIKQLKEATENQITFEWFAGLNYLYDSANEHKLIPFTAARKREILALCNDDIDLAKSETYKLWITEMAENGMSLDENGELI